MRIVIAVIVLIAGACGPLFPPKPEPPPNPSGEVEADCRAACGVLSDLGCPGHEGSPGEDEQFGTDDDVPCWKACVEIVESDPTVTLNQRCTAKADSCGEVEACFGPD